MGKLILYFQFFFQNRFYRVCQKKKSNQIFLLKNMKLLVFEKNLHFAFSFVSNSGTTTVILGVVIPIAICLIIIVVVVIILLFRRKKRQPKHNNVELHVNKDTAFSPKFR